MPAPGPAVLVVPLDTAARVVHAPVAGLAGYSRLLGGGPVVPLYPSIVWRLYVVDSDAGVNVHAMRLAQWADLTWTRLLHGPVLVAGASATPGLDTDVPPPVVHHVRGN